PDQHVKSPAQISDIRVDQAHTAAQFATTATVPLADHDRVLDPGPVATRDHAPQAATTRTQVPDHHPGAGNPMSSALPARAHLIAGGFPPGSAAGHDHDYARLRLLQLLAERDIPASVANDFADVEKWLSVSRLLITYVAGPYPDAAQTRAIERWLEAG